MRIVPIHIPMTTLTVQDAMTTPVQTITMDHAVGELREIFARVHYHHLVVTDEEGICVGVISDRDVLRSISPFVGKMAERNSDIATLKRRAHQIMTRQLVAARPCTTLRDAARIMLDHKVSCLPVLDAKRHCIGILTLRDIARLMIQALDRPDSAQAA
jgi:acetoin utilization protein AcuB